MNDPIDDLEAKLTQAARRRHRVRAHSRRCAGRRVSSSRLLVCVPAAAIVSAPPAQGEVVLTLRPSDVNEHNLTLPAAPNLNEFNSRLKKGEIPRHEQGGP